MHTTPTVLRRTDRNGVTIHEGDIVLTNRGAGTVLLVEGPIPGSRVTREGMGTFYCRVPHAYGQLGVYTADRLTVVPCATLAEAIEMDYALQQAKAAA